MLVLQLKLIGKNPAGILNSINKHFVETAHLYDNRSASPQESYQSLACLVARNALAASHNAAFPNATGFTKKARRNRQLHEVTDVIS